MTPEQAAALRKPFPASAIGKLPKGGVLLDYVGHAATTDRLLSVDPDWTWEPLAYTEDGLPALDGGGNLWIKLTVCDVTRLGVGDGKSAKECIGDAIRNAAMRFGVALDLWAKEDLHDQGDTAQPQGGGGPEPEGRRMSRPKPSTEPAGVTPAQITKLGAAMSEIGLTARKDALAYVADVIGRKVESRNELTKAEAHKVIDALERDLRQEPPEDNR